MEVNLNIISCENFIPLEWLVLFATEQKGYFYTHTGFGAIHHDAIYYSAEIKEGIKRMSNAESILTDVISNRKDELRDYPNPS